MTDVVDGSFDNPEGRKLFVSQRPGESSEEFATRAMGFLYAINDAYVLDQVASSTPEDWTVLPSDRWLDAVNRTEPKLHLRLTTLPANAGGAIGHLVVDWADSQVADEWGDEQEGAVYLPRPEDGRISTRQAVIWSLLHEIKGLGDLYDASFERSGLIVE